MGLGFRFLGLGFRGSWVVISGVISRVTTVIIQIRGLGFRVTIVIIQIRGFITPPITTHEPPSRVSGATRLRAVRASGSVAKSRSARTKVSSA